MDRGDKDKFINWLQQRMDWNRALLKQIEMLPRSIAEPMKKIYAAEAAACKIVQEMLQNSETIELGEAPSDTK